MRTNPFVKNKIHPTITISTHLTMPCAITSIIPHSEFRIPNSEFRIPNSELKKPDPFEPGFYSMFDKLYREITWH